MKKLSYRCENEYGPDPCEYALNNYTIPESEVTPALGGGRPKCPGKTRSGLPCNADLIPIAVGKGRWGEAILAEGRLWMVLLGGAFFLLLLAGVWYLSPLGLGQSQPSLLATPNPLLFSGKPGGKKSAQLTIRNNGEGELVIDRIEVRPAAFSVSGEKVRIKAKGAAKLPVRFDSPSIDLTEGELVLHSNDQKSPTTIKLVANRDPWWVFRKLESTSTLLQKEP